MTQGVPIGSYCSLISCETGMKSADGKESSLGLWLRCNGFGGQWCLSIRIVSPGEGSLNEVCRVVCDKLTLFPSDSAWWIAQWDDGVHSPSAGRAFSVVRLILADCHMQQKSMELPLSWILWLSHAAEEYRTATVMNIVTACIHKETGLLAVLSSQHHQSSSSTQFSQ